MTDQDRKSAFRSSCTTEPQSPHHNRPFLFFFGQVVDVSVVFLLNRRSLLEEMNKKKNIPMMVFRIRL